jgi:predicted component of viral defense system (DUF524 family)
VHQLESHIFEFRNTLGQSIGSVLITPMRVADSLQAAPLLQISPDTASEFGETEVQLRESERYEYEIQPSTVGDLRLRCSLATRRRSLGDQGRPDAGIIDTRSFCGTLVLEIVEGEVDGLKTSVAMTLADVRSVKVDYRTEYRGMLRRISDEIAGLVADARSSAKTTFLSAFNQRTDHGWLQIQLELLRETIESPEFPASMQRILTYPHEQLSRVNELVSSESQFPWTPSTLCQLLTRSPRHQLPVSHPLTMSVGLASVATHVMLRKKVKNLDTPENRFVKYALEEFHSFLMHAAAVFSASTGWQATALLARRLSEYIDGWLGRSIFLGIGALHFAPLGSPVLQRKPGYRELMRWWLRFRTAAEISWKGGEDVFHAGQRNVATLYEYWLFFVLLSWFCKTCRNGDRPPIEDLIDGLSDNAPNLSLKKRIQLGPFSGTFRGQSRRLNARFSYNRRFHVTRSREEAGSWTRQLHPDYTLSFWPESMDEAAAEREELLVHLHFDAKYRVDDIEALFGAEDSDDFSQDDKNYNRHDLLKMHAYRDAIKRSQGAYVIYPGRSDSPTIFSGFHEILPGLGAFAVSPDANGEARGIAALDAFLCDVLAHIGNRTTAQERAGYHVFQSYAAKEHAVECGDISLPEWDYVDSARRALPPAEHKVLIIWFNGDVPTLLSEASEGLSFVSLGRQSGSVSVDPNLFSARHILHCSYGSTNASKLLLLREPEFRIYNREQLRAELYRAADNGGDAAWHASAADDEDDTFYALFRTKADPHFESIQWSSELVLRCVGSSHVGVESQAFPTDGGHLPGPSLLSLRNLLNARILKQNVSRQ